MRNLGYLRQIKFETKDFGKEVYLIILNSLKEFFFIQAIQLT